MTRWPDQQRQWTDNNAQVVAQSPRTRIEGLNESVRRGFQSEFRKWFGYLK
jgi:hypothetical protein